VGFKVFGGKVLGEMYSDLKLGAGIQVFKTAFGALVFRCGGPSDTPLCYLCTCEQCGNILIDGTCLKYNYGAGNSFTYDPTPKNGAHDGYNCPSQVPFIQTLPSFLQQYPCCEDYGVNPSLNIQNEPDDHELFINELIQQKLQNEYAQPFPAIAITFDLPTEEANYSLRMGDEHLNTILETESDEFIKSSVENLVPNPSKSEDLSDSECDVPVCDNFTTFSNLLFDADDDFSSSDDESFSNEDISKEIYSNPLFNEEIISIRMYPHYFNVEPDLIESLLNHDSSIISSSSKIDSLLDEFAGELILIKSIPSGIDKTDCDPKEEILLTEKFLYDNSSPRPPKEFNSKNYDAAIESFSPSPILVEDGDPFMEEIDLFLASDGSIPLGIDSDYYDSKGDIIILE
nr:hypothetical protein [Tanacetum cinerariifolium]